MSAMVFSTLRCAVVLGALAACYVAPLETPRLAPVTSPTTRIATSSIAGREYVDALYNCARDNLRQGVKLRDPGEAQIAFVIRDSRIINPHFVRASGTPEFDKAALDAVKACDGRIPTPYELRNQLATEGLSLAFNPNDIRRMPAFTPGDQRHGPAMAACEGVPGCKR
jgi:hypothetical protein